MKARYQIVTVIFDANELGFDRLRAAFIRSARANAGPDAAIRVIQVRRPKCEAVYKPTYPDNTQKLHIWRDVVKAAKIPTVLLDIDTLVLRDPSAAFDEGEFDIGITVRPHKMWINAGAIYARPTRGARDFMDAWVTENDRLYAEPDEMYDALKRHNGLNQTAMLNMIESGIPTTCTMAKLECVTWNNCDQTWVHFDPKTTAVLHIKGGLRKYALEQWPGHGPEHLAVPLQVWRIYDGAKANLPTGVMADAV